MIRNAYVALPRDCRDGAEVRLRAETEGIVEVPASVYIAPGVSRAAFSVEGLSIGRTRLVAEMAQGSEAPASATLMVSTISAELPSCTSEMAQGTVEPGTELKVVGGSIAGGSVVDGTVACGSVTEDSVVCGSVVGGSGKDRSNLR